MFLVPIQRAIMGGTVSLLSLLLFYAVLGNHWLAVARASVFLTGVFARGSQTLAVASLVGIFLVTSMIVLRKFGLVSFLSLLFVYLFVKSLSLTTNFSAWYAGSGLLGLVLIALSASYGFYTSTLAGRHSIPEKVL